MPSLLVKDGKLVRTGGALHLATPECIDECCNGGADEIHLVLIRDRSASIETSVGGISLIDEQFVQSSAMQFVVDHLDPTSSGTLACQVAVVAFAESHVVVQSLTSSRALIEAAITASEDIDLGDETDLDAAILGAIAASPSSASEKIALLFGDGVFSSADLPSTANKSAFTSAGLILNMYVIGDAAALSFFALDETVVSELGGSWVYNPQGGSFDFCDLLPLLPSSLQVNASCPLSSPPYLYAATDLIQIGGLAAEVPPAASSRLAYYDGVRWRSPYWSIVEGSGGDESWRDSIFFNGLLHAACFGFTVDTIVNPKVVRWDDAAGRWIDTGSSSLTGTPSEFAIYNGSLYLGTDSGLFIWNGSSWSAVAGAPSGSYNSLHVFNSLLYVGGDFSGLIRSYNGSTFSTLGNGLEDHVTGFVPSVNVIRDDGSSLLIGGRFSREIGTSSPILLDVCAWTGSAYAALPSGGGGVGDLFGGSSMTTAPVYAICVVGSDIFVGGEFDRFTNVIPSSPMPALNVARFSGGAWSALSTGLSTRVTSAAAYQSSAHFGGNFPGRIVRWNGSAFVAVGSPSATTGPFGIPSLRVY